MTAARRLSMQPDNLRRLLTYWPDQQPKRSGVKKGCCPTGQQSLFKNTRRKQRDGGVLGRERACAILRYDAVESLYGERHESEPQGLRSAWDAPTNKNGPHVALALNQGSED